MVEDVKDNPLVSVIIPTYNRAYLINETLESIIQQTYNNWECIIVDDGSSDDTALIMENYMNTDSRITYCSRPQSYKKGANSCRNFGFEKSTGKLIIWFDSDDLMTPDHIEAKVQKLINSNKDFIISRTANFRGEEIMEPYTYIKKPYGIKASDFILLKIHWYTYDVILKREIAEVINWNINMNSWQDYNYFCKMLLITEKGEFFDKVLTYRRLHHESIQRKLTSSSVHFKEELLINRILTFNDLKREIDLETLKELVHGMMNLCFELALLKRIPKRLKIVTGIVKPHLGVKRVGIFLLSLIFAFIFGKGHILLEKSKGR